MEKSVFLSHFPQAKTFGWKKLSLGHLQNNKGQTLITWLVLLSVSLLIILSLGSALILVQNRMQVMNICRLEGLRIQNEVTPLIKGLFALNPEARSLRVQLILAQARLATALALVNIPAATQARIEISQIRAQQHLLVATQKTIIQTANIKLHSGTFSTYEKLKTALAQIKSRSRGWVEVDFILHTPKVPQLAVKPEDYNLAPPYLPRKNFESQQVTSQFWQETYRFKIFLKSVHRSYSQCHATLEENSWEPKIKRDKLYSKWL